MEPSREDLLLMIPSAACARLSAVPRADAELAEEIQQHIALRTPGVDRGRGLDPREAALGGAPRPSAIALLVREESRQMWGFASPRHARPGASGFGRPAAAPLAVGFDPCRGRLSGDWDRCGRLRSSASLDTLARAACCRSGRPRSWSSSGGCSGPELLSFDSLKRLNGQTRPRRDSVQARRSR